MNLTNISSNGHNVISSGSVIGFNNTPQFVFTLRNTTSDFNFNVELIFKEDNKYKEQIINSTVEQNNIIITCYNFNNPLASGLSSSLELATVAGKKIYFRFIARDMHTLPILTYCFYSE